jgi:hypothetical protein
VLDSKIIEVALPLTFSFILVSFVCSAFCEFIEMFLKYRATCLERGIRGLVGMKDQEFVKQLYSHSLISSLYEGPYSGNAFRFFGGQNLPSYIPSQNFALALIDMRNAGVSLPANVREAVRAFEQVAGSDVALLQQLIESWYNSAMDRVSGRFKRRTQFVLIVIGLAFTVVLNVDCVSVVNKAFLEQSLLQKIDQDQRAEQLAESSVNQMPRPNPGQPEIAQNASDVASRVRADLMSAAAMSESTRVLGRDYSLENPNQVWVAYQIHWLGWLLTALIVSVLAPLWFDLQNKIMNIRSTTKPSGERRDKSGKDVKPVTALDPSAED